MKKPEAKHFWTLSLLIGIDVVAGQRQVKTVGGFHFKKS
jgi:hypothetical protein